MGNDRRWSIAVMVAAGIVSAGHGAAADRRAGSGGDPLQDRPPAIEVTCSPVNISWPPSGSTSALMPGPELSVVSTDFRPKDVPLFLDGRFVGRARYFNGKKGFLYLKPGRYELVVESSGLRTEVFSIEARPGCRFDIKHRMVQGRRGVGLEFEAPPGKGKPNQWIYGPVGDSTQPREAVPRRGPGPDPSLRPDLGATRPAADDRAQPKGSLRIRVRPLSAKVYLDGRLLATGDEIARMVEPLSVPAGSHTILVRAAGYTDRTVILELEKGATEELDVVLNGSSR